MKCKKKWKLTMKNIECKLWILRSMCILDCTIRNVKLYFGLYNPKCKITIWDINLYYGLYNP